MTSSSTAFMRAGVRRPNSLLVKNVKSSRIQDCNAQRSDLKHGFKIIVEGINLFQSAIDFLSYHFTRSFLFEFNVHMKNRNVTFRFLTSYPRLKL